MGFSIEQPCPDIRDLLARYITEIAALFPGSYLHLGGDEVWNLNSCERCRSLVDNFDDEANLLVRSKVKTTAF